MIYLNIVLILDSGLNGSCMEGEREIYTFGLGLHRLAN